jgi:Phosphoenolpyruvate carboxylase
LRDIENLRWELSIQQCSDEITQALGHQHPEPYREYLRDIRERLKITRAWLAEKLHGKDADDSRVIKSKDELLKPLLTCYRSLMACNLAELANSSLLDLIYRVNCFGIELLKLDIRQESVVIVRPFQPLLNIWVWVILKPGLNRPVKTSCCRNCKANVLYYLST